MGKLLRDRIKTIKKLTNNGRKELELFDFGGSLVKTGFEFNEPASEKELKLLDNLDLPDDYLELFQISNGLKLFSFKYENINMGFGCDIFSIDNLLNEMETSNNSGFPLEPGLIPILHILDNGYMFIDTNSFKKRENYLTFPGMEMDKYFNFSFEEWLDRYVVGGGHEFWNVFDPNVKMNYK